MYSDARLQLEHGDLSSALAKANEGFKQSGQDPVWSWKFRVLRAEIALWLADNTQVIELLTPSPPKELSTGEFSVLAKATKAMALAHLRKDEDAEALLKDAAGEADGSAPYLKCQVVEYQGYQAWIEKKPELALQRFTEALQLSRQFKQSFMEVGAINGLGLIFTTMRRYDDGIERSFNALDLAHSHQYGLAENIALTNLAWSYKELGDLEKALSYFSQQEKILDSLGNEQLKQIVEGNIGDTQSALRDYASARISYQKALAIAQEMDREKRSEEKSRIVDVLAHLAETAFNEGKVQEAEEYNNKASALAAAPRTVLMAARIAAARNHLPEAKHQLIAILEKGDSGEDEQSFDSQFLQWDARDELAKISAAEHDNRGAEMQYANLINRVEDFRRSVAVAEHRLAFSSHAEGYYDDYVHFLMESGHPQKAFQVAEFSRARTLAEGVGLKAPDRPSNVNIVRIQEFVRDRKRTILAYWVAPKASYVWLLSATQFKFATLSPGRVIEQAAKSYNETLLGREDADKLEQQARGLYDLLVNPVQQFITRKAKLVIIPDRELDKLNFETLRPQQRPSHFWIQDVEMQVASSTTMLLGKGRQHIDHERKLLLIGNPLQANTEYPALRHAAQEIEKVKGYFSSRDEIVISGPQAVPGVYASSHPEKFDVIHFVTHGTASELSPLDSAIILSSDQQSSFKLYARDIIKTRLKADIVTISACYGLGTRTYSGEGLVGLAWAFLQAGAHRVVAGLWEVDEMASVGLMDNFYAAIRGGQSPSEALRSAKLKMIERGSKYQRPLYWAAFQIYMGS